LLKKVSELESRNAKLIEELPEMIKREAQSLKDKRFDKVERTYGTLSELSSVLDDLRERGVEIPDGVMKDLAFEDMQRKVSELGQNREPSGGSGDSGFDESEITSILAKAGLNPEKAREVRSNWASKEYGTRVDALFDLARLASDASAPDPAGRISPSGGGGSPNAIEDIDDPHELLNMGLNN
jgi:hypothetical protein